MSAHPPSPIRVRSGLSLPLPADWQVIDSLEARGPDGMTLSATSFPVDPRVELAELVRADAVAGVNAIGASQNSTIFGNHQGLVQRFDSTEADGGFSQLAGYALWDGRVYVARATCHRSQFERLESSMRASLTTIGIGGGRETISTGERSSTEATTLDRYTAGQAICALPERTTEDHAAASAGWTCESPATSASATDTELVLTTAELSVIAHLYGQPSFPSTRPLSAATAAAVESAARSVLLARSLVRFRSLDDFEIDDAVHLMVVLAFQAQLIVDVAVTGVQPTRCAYFVGARESLRVMHHDGDIHVCSPIATADLFADLMATIGELPDDGDGPDTLDRGAIDPAAAVRRVSLRRVATDAGRVELDSISMISVVGSGCYAADDCGQLLRVSSPEQRRRLLHAIVG